MERLVSLTDRETLEYLLSKGGVLFPPETYQKIRMCRAHISNSKCKYNGVMGCKTCPEYVKREG